VTAEERSAHAVADHGTLAEEAAKLVGALEQWWSAAGFGPPPGPAGDEAHGSAGDEARPANPDADGAACRFCPVCAGIRAVRGTHPEVFAHLTDASASILLAVRAFVESAEASWVHRPQPPVQRIDIT
jgi:hypothetical protein